MKRTIWGMIFLCFLIKGYAQEVFQQEKRDYIWLIGYGSFSNDARFDNMRMDFHENPVVISRDPRHLWFDITNANISDADGNLLFYTNGIAIHNHLNELMENGDGLNPDPYTQWWVHGGYIHYQGVLILPLPGSTSLYYLLHSERSIPPPNVFENNTVVFNSYKTLVDMEQNAGAGKVLEKNVPLITDTLDFGKIVGTRHANGRDW
ncbi:MAG: hypothetical protein HUU01_13130 [Saprospiraceae bacterium]|nr:hypothetical protein [Saprospiraceae bacterium]